MWEKAPPGNSFYGANYRTSHEYPDGARRYPLAHSTDRDAHAIYSPPDKWLSTSFLLPTGDAKGGAFYCRKMARQLGAEQPFYILEPYKFDGLRVLPTFAAMATAHLELIRSIQPEGPYQMGGWCNGALLAYEMARQLRARGQTVSLLVLMD